MVADLFIVRTEPNFRWMYRCQTAIGSSKTLRSVMHLCRLAPGNGLDMLAFLLASSALTLQTCAVDLEVEANQGVRSL